MLYAAANHVTEHVRVCVFCSQVTGGRTIDETLMPDTLHPNRFGFKMLLDQCFEPALYGDAAVKEAAGIGR